MVQFLRRAYSPDHFLNVAIARAYSLPGSSSYAHRLSSALNVFSDLFVSANGRPHEPMLDGFHMLLEGLGKIAFKFQHRFSLLLASVQVHLSKKIVVGDSLYSVVLCRKTTSGVSIVTPGQTSCLATSMAPGSKVGKPVEPPRLFSHEVLPLSGSLFPGGGGGNNSNAPVSIHPVGAISFSKPVADVKLRLLPGNCGHYICSACEENLKAQKIEGCPICMPDGIRKDFDDQM